ncbi:MAG: hypothetical protein COB98_05040, partial [Flavobacteriaceae bacterium]
YTLTIKDTVNGCTGSDTAEIKENKTLPIANAGSNQLLTCAITEVTLKGVAPTSGTYTYAWSGPNGFTADGITTTANKKGIYTLTIKDTVNGCTGSDTAEIKENITSPIANAGSDQLLTCAITEVTLKGESPTVAGTYTYAWTGPNDFTADGLSTTANKTGIYTLTIKDTVNGCTGSDTAEITENKTAPIANAGSDQLLTCAIPEVILQGEVPTAGGPYIYGWTGPNEFTAIGLFIIVNENGIYTFTITDKVNGCSASDTVEISRKLSVIDYLPEENISKCNWTNFNLKNISEDQNMEMSSVLYFEDMQFQQEVLSPESVLAGEYYIVFENELGCKTVKKVVFNNITCSLQLTEEVRIPSDGAYDELGELVYFDFKLYNKGDVPVSDIKLINDGEFQIIYVSGDTNLDNILDVNEVWLYTASYAITQLDLDRGYILTSSSAFGRVNDTEISVLSDDPFNSEDKDDDNDGYPDDITVVIIGSEESTLFDLSISKEVMNVSFKEGVSNKMLVHVFNDLGQKVSGVTVVEFLPVGFMYIDGSASNAGQYNKNSNTITWSHLNIDKEELLLTYDFELNAPLCTTDEYLSISEITSMDGEDVDSIPGNYLEGVSEDDIALYTIELPVGLLDFDMFISNETPDIIKKSSIVEIEFTLRNDTDFTASNVEMQLSLGDGLHLLSVIGGDGLLMIDKLRWSVKEMSSKAEYKITIEVEVFLVGDYNVGIEFISGDGLCSSTITSPITKVLAPKISFVLPTAFTPNNDEVNDVFKIPTLPVLYPNFEMKIYNRYGSLIFNYEHNGDINMEPNWWNGKLNNGESFWGTTLLPTGTYFYTIRYNDGKTKPLSSWVYLQK